MPRKANVVPRATALCCPGPRKADVVPTATALCCPGPRKADVVPRATALCCPGPRKADVIRPFLVPWAGGTHDPGSWGEPAVAACQKGHEGLPAGEQLRQKHITDYPAGSMELTINRKVAEASSKCSYSVAQAGVQWHDHRVLQLPNLGSSDPPTSASQSAAGITGVSHCTRPLSLFNPRWGFTMLSRLVLNARPCYPPALATQSAGITGVSHHAQPTNQFKNGQNFLLDLSPKKT
ncbi:hypothetical protein AAY473_023345, partial [Plecturocebus cupreus]